MDADNQVNVFASIMWIYCLIWFKFIFIYPNRLPNENTVSILLERLSPPERLSVIYSWIHIVTYWIHLSTWRVSPVVSVGNVFLDLVNSVPSVLTKFIWVHVFLQNVFILLKIRILIRILISIPKTTLKSSELNFLPVRRHSSRVLKNIFHLREHKNWMNAV